jgi:hypothetical protein
MISGSGMPNFRHLGPICLLKRCQATVLDEIYTFDTILGNKTHANARIVRSLPAGTNWTPLLVGARNVAKRDDSEKWLRQKTVLLAGGLSWTYFCTENLRIMFINSE